MQNHADFGRSDVWRPTVVARIGGSRWVSALPTGSEWVQGEIADRRRAVEGMLAKVRALRRSLENARRP